MYIQINTVTLSGVAIIETIHVKEFKLYIL